MARACMVLEGPGCSNFLIAEYGKVVANEAEIIAEGARVRASLQAGRPPVRERIPARTGISETSPSDRQRSRRGNLLRVCAGALDRFRNGAGVPQPYNVHRNVEFAVASGDGIEWNWYAYPRNEHVNAGEPLFGRVRGKEADAIKLCKAAIDGASDGETSH